MTLPKFAFFKGQIVPYNEAKLGILTHTFNYGTGIFGGVRAYWNNEEEQLFLFRPLDHFRRFLNSAKLLLMDLPYSEADLSQAVVDLLRAENYRTDTYIRPLAYFSDEIIGVRLHNLTADVAIASIPFGSYVDNEEGLHATISSWRRIDDNMIPARGKISGAYVNSALIKTDAQRAGFDEGIVLNQNGHVAEGSAENFFMCRDGVAYTPPITDNILEGITRRTIMMLLHDDLGVEVVERPIDRTEIYLADEAFFCGTGVQIAAITKVDHRPIGTGRLGPIAKQLRKVYFDVVRGRVAKYQKFCSPVYQRTEPMEKR
ncbi:MAG TPA: branched-chain amino acid transaminase [Acidobacteriota bacterium]|nr:branched-chain amino acid transaminase [Acidobacteriota bacterium]